MGPLTTLAITRLGADCYSFVLEKPPDANQPFAAPFVPCAEVRIPGELVPLMRDRIAAAVGGHSVSARAGEDPFLIPGRTLFDALLPRLDGGARDIREALKGLNTPLLISTNEPEMPWEMLHDGEGFLGLKLAVGRSLRDRGEVDAGRGAGEGDGRRCLLVSDPTGDLPSAASEAVALRRVFEARGFACEQLDGAEATFDAVLDRLAGGRFSIFHYAGHIGQSDAEHGEFAFALHGRRFMPASMVERCANAPGVVFLNGCQSAQMVEGLTRAFLRAGSRLVLGSLFDAPSRGAAEFSQGFYEAFLSGKPAGEAARAARSMVRAAGSSGAAWACFVLYGDPRFAVGSDPLQSLLKATDLSRAGFEPSARTVLEAAHRLAERAGVLTATHLFAALVQGADPYLRERLRERGVRPESLARSFMAELSAVAAGGGKEVSVSGNARNALLAAARAANAAGRSAASERDLLKGLVSLKGASPWRILRGIGVRPLDLDPDRSECDIVSVGPLQRAGCDEVAWSVLCCAAAMAERGGTGAVGSPDLFSALLARPDGALAAALRRLEVPLEARGGSPDGSLPRASVPAVPCSRNCQDMLGGAQTIAATTGRPVSEQDLLAAFVEAGGGAGGALLQSKGLILRCLTSNLFLDGGLIDTSRLSDTAIQALDAGVEFARQKEYAAVGRRHILFGLLSLKTGAMAARIREQGHDSEVLADLLYATLPAGGTPGRRLELRASCFTGDTLKILCAAETAALRDGEAEIGDRRLLEAWVEDGGGLGGSFLVQNNIRLRKLNEESGGIAPQRPH